MCVRARESASAYTGIEEERKKGEEWGRARAREAEMGRGKK